MNDFYCKKVINENLDSLKENKRVALEEKGGKFVIPFEISKFSVNISFFSKRQQDLGDGTFEIIEEYQEPEPTSKTKKPTTVVEEKKTAESQPKEKKAQKKEVTFSEDTKPGKVHLSLSIIYSLMIYIRLKKNLLKKSPNLKWREWERRRSDSNSNAFLDGARICAYFEWSNDN